MRSLLVPLVVTALLTAACAHEAPPPEAPLVATAPPVPHAAAEEPTYEIPAPATARRLDRTITLGADSNVYGPRAAAPSGPAPAAAPTVIVNNHVNVNPGYGWGGFYGGYAPTVGAGTTTGTTTTGTTSPSTSAAGTPPIGGDWPKIPSYGPPMR